MKYPFSDVGSAFDPGRYARLPSFPLQQSPLADVPVQALSDKIIFSSPTAGGQFQSSSGELANGLFRERYDNA